MQWIASISYGIKESALAHYHDTLQKYLLPVFGAYTMQQLDERSLNKAYSR